MITHIVPDDYKFDADEKVRLLEALRSGRYGQATGRLRSKDDNYCCLGVHLDVNGKGEWAPGPDKVWSYEIHPVAGSEFVDWSATGLPEPLCYNQDTAYADVPFRVTEEMIETLPWLGSLSSALENTSLALLNDEGATFAQIADLIEYRF